MKDPIQESIYQYLALHPYTIYFSNELMQALHLSFTDLQQALIVLAKNNLVDYKDASTENCNDFMVKFVFPIT
jgi:hypothetical protein